MGIFRRKVQKHIDLAARALRVMLAEDERVYRNHVAMFASEYQNADVQALGLLKARLLSSAFPAVAFRNRWALERPEECALFLHAASGFATTPLIESGAMSLDDCRLAGEAFYLGRVQLIDQELAEGPSSLGTGGLSSEQLREFSTPGALRDPPKELGIADPDSLERYFTQGVVPEKLTRGFRGLVEGCHEALTDSVGAVFYDQTI